MNSKANGGYIIREPEKLQAVRDALFIDGKPNRHSVGQSPEKIAELAGIEIPEGTKVIVVVAEGTGKTDSLGGEKMGPVIAAYKYKTLEEGVNIARENLEKDGKGHSVSFHSDSEDHIKYVGNELCVSRFVINSGIRKQCRRKLFQWSRTYKYAGMRQHGDTTVSQKTWTTNIS